MAVAQLPFLAMVCVYHYRAYARNAKFVNCDFTNAVVDRYYHLLLTLYLHNPVSHRSCLS